MPLKTALTQEQIDILYQIFDKFDTASRIAHFPYYMAAGTALGAVRHGGLIPWDDDGDLYALEPQFRTSAFQLFHAANQLGLHIRPHKLLKSYDSDSWFKIYLGEHNIPNVDLFLMKWNTSEHAWTLSDSKAAEWWPKERLTHEQITRATRATFGPLKLPLFGNPEMYLTRTYGNDWQVIAWDGNDHVNEANHRPPRANERTIKNYEPALPSSTWKSTQ